MKFEASFNERRYTFTRDSDGTIFVNTAGGCPTFKIYDETPIVVENNHEAMAEACMKWLRKYRNV